MERHDDGVHRPDREVALTVEAHVLPDGRCWGSVRTGAEADVGFEGWLELLAVLHCMLGRPAGEVTRGPVG